MSYQQNFNDLNNYLQKATEAVTCGASCQREKTKNELKQKFFDSEVNLVTAPQQVVTSLKNYLEYSQGNTSYNDYLDNDLKNKADVIAKTFNDNFQKEVENVSLLIGSYNGILLNFNHLVEYYASFYKQNIKLSNKVKITLSDVQTNDRKTFYEDQNIDRLKLFYKIILGVYILIIIIFIGCMILVPTNYSRKIQYISLLGLFIYPFVCYPILKFIIFIYNKIVEFLPKNVYKTL
jgi:hypothetical protein